MRFFRLPFWGAAPFWLTDLRAKGAEDARFTALADIVDAHNGLWCPEAEEYLLANFQQHD